MKKISLTLCVVLLTISTTLAQKSPFFDKGEDPKLEKSKWKLIKNMSDEFNDNEVNQRKWQISGQDWIGRAPGLFLAENVKEADGSLQIQTTQLPKVITKQGKDFTHGGGYAGSIAGMTFGYYECRMKANKTFMSSTFWLINEKEDSKGCDQRTTELDIQESIGQITNDQPFSLKFDNHMNSNTHSRHVKAGCNIPEGIEGAKAQIDGKVYDNFHIYGVWWKSKDEVLFFLDGKFHAKVKPAANFNIPMHLRMVVETYDWNPVPEDGGMTGSIEDRTTYYDWVRSWKLVD